MRWQDGKSKRVKVRRNFSIIAVAQRLVRKMSEEGVYLYLKRQSEGTWIDSKCHIPIKNINLNEWGALLRVLVMDPSLGWMRWSVGSIGE